MTSSNYATIINDDTSRLRYLSDMHTFQIFGPAQSTTLPIHAVLSSNAHTDVIRITSNLTDIETNVRGKKQFYGMQANTPATPSYSWSENPTTGMYQPEANVIAFATNSTEQVRVSQIGNVGIGTTAMQATLHVHGSAYATSFLTPTQLIGTLTQSGTRFTMSNVSLAFTSNALATYYNGAAIQVLQQDSKIGVGTVAPFAFVHVQNTGSSNQAGIMVSNPTANGSQDAPLLLKTASPNGTAFVSYEVGTNPVNGWSCGVEANTFKVKRISQFNTSALVATNPFVITAAGNVGIGTTNPVAQAHVSGAVTIDGQLTLRESGVPLPSVGGWELRTFSISGLNTKFINAHGAYSRVYCDGLYATAELNVNTATIRGTSMTSGAYAFEVKQSASISQDLKVDGIIYNNTGITPISSDERLKTNVQTLQNSLEKVCALRGVTYEWRRRESHPSSSGVGFIAQEVGAVFPNMMIKGMCSPDEASLLGGSQCYTYTISSEFFAHLVESIKTLKARVEALESQLASRPA